MASCGKVVTDKMTLIALGIQDTQRYVNDFLHTTVFWFRSASFAVLKDCL